MIEPADVPTITSAVRASQPEVRLEGGQHPGVVRLADEATGAQHEPDSGHRQIVSHQAERVEIRR